MNTLTKEERELVENFRKEKEEKENAKIYSLKKKKQALKVLFYLNDKVNKLPEIPNQGIYRNRTFLKLKEIIDDNRWAEEVAYEFLSKTKGNKGDIARRFYEYGPLLNINSTRDPRELEDLKYNLKEIGVHII